MKANDAHPDRAEPNLYRQVLGDAWGELAEPVRRAHAAGTEKRGCFRISHGTGWVARHLVRWSNLPRATRAAATRLRISTEGAGQLWERDFGGQQFTTRQWAGEGGYLVERFGPWEFRFRLRVEEAALRYAQCGARLCLGRLRLPWPLAWAPLISAKETPDGPQRVRVTVAVTFPVVGLLIAYDGHLELGEEE